MVEGPLLTDHRLHATHPSRELRVFDVQFDVGGKLASMAVRAQVVGAQHFHLAHCGQDWLGAQVSVMSLLAAGTRKSTLIGRRGWELQKFAESQGSSVMHGGTHRHLDGFQIEAARLAPAVEDDAQQSVYFAGDFPLDRFGRFFSCGVCSVCSSGRKRQTVRLTSTNLLVKD